MYHLSDCRVTIHHPPTGNTEVLQTIRRPYLSHLSLDMEYAYHLELHADLGHNQYRNDNTIFWTQA